MNRSGIRCGPRRGPTPRKPYARPGCPALDALREAGFRLAIVSDSTEETVRVWPELTLASRFDAAIFSFTEGVCKPNPRMYRRAMDAIGRPAARCAYVGDGGSRELTGAEALGVTAFMFRFPDQNQDAPRFDEDFAWRGRRLADLRELTALAAARPSH